MAVSQEDRPRPVVAPLWWPAFADLESISVFDPVHSIAAMNDQLLAGDVVRLRSRTLACAAALVCGAMNNFSFCIISGASQSFARQFHKESQVTLITSAMCLSALAATVISTNLLMRFPFYTRLALVFGMTATAYIGVAFSATLDGEVGFSLVAILSCVASMAQIFGETAILAFLKVFPPELMGFWGAGTGCAGILGGALYILLGGPLGLSNAAIFLLITPTVLAYWAAFHYLQWEAAHGLQGLALARAMGGHFVVVNGARDAANNGCGDCEGAAEGTQSTSGAAAATQANTKETIACCGSIMFHFVAVYCLEYMIYPGLDDRETLCAGNTWYTAMWVCYNVGVTISRFSVALCRISHVWVLTALQLVNSMGWTLEVYTGAVRNSMPSWAGMYLMACWMVLTGLCGGAAYSNCMYLFNCKPGIPDRLRELAINLSLVMSNVGITAVIFSFVYLDATVLNRSVLYPDGCLGQ